MQIMIARDPSSHDWHARPADDVLAAMEAGRQGLTADQAAERLQRHGRNVLPPPKRRGPFMRFLLQFHNVLIYVLLAAAGITAMLGHWVDSGVILGMVVINRPGHSRHVGGSARLCPDHAGLAPEDHLGLGTPQTKTAP